MEQEILEGEEFLQDEELFDELEEEEPFDDSEYFALLDTDEIGEGIQDKVESFDAEIRANGFYEFWIKKWQWYYGRFHDDDWSNYDRGLMRMGENGEYIFFGSNQFRAMGKTIYGLAVQNEPSWEIESTNTDSRSNIMASVGKTVLDFYMYHLRAQNRIKKATEHCLVFDAGYVFVEWDPLAGAEFGENINQETGKVEPVGDLRLTNPTAFEIVFDTYKADWEDQDWVIVREWMDKELLITRFPEWKQEIIDSTSKEDEVFYDRSISIFRLGGNRELNNDVLVNKLLHRKTESIPEGRLAWALQGGQVLTDTHLPYHKIPLERMVADEFIGNCFGYSPLNDLLPHQETLNVLNSAIITNQYTNAVQYIAVEDGVDLNPRDLGRGIVILNYPRGAEAPRGVNLTATAPEVFKYREDIIREMELLSGVSGISRGQQTGSQMSGSAMALMASMTAQNQGVFQQNYADLAGRVATTMLKILSTHATHPRTISVMGKHNSGKTAFTGTEDLVDFDHVRVNLGNPILRTYAGKMEIANQLLEKNAITLEQYWELMTSGNLEALNEGPREELNYIRLENEKLLAGIKPNPHFTDNHELHLATHRKLLQLPAIRFPEEEEELTTAQIVQDHMLEHEQFMAQALVNAGPPIPVEGDPAAQPPQGGQAPQEPGQVTADETAAVSAVNPAVDQAAAAGTTLPRQPNIAGTNTQYPG